MEELVLHKVAFTDEAVFDYEHCLIYGDYPPQDYDIDWQKPCMWDEPFFRFPKQEIKAELEEYIQRHNTIKYKHYFRVRHYDEQHEDWLLLFIRQGKRVGKIQDWTVVGICYEYDFCEEMEEDGINRAWYETKITDLPNDDWVEELRIRQQIETEESEKDEKERTHYERLQS